MRAFVSILVAAVSSAFMLAAQAGVAGKGEVNVYSYRQAYLVRPLFDAFTRETGVTVTVVHARKGLMERLKQEGRNSPADLILTVDIGRLTDVVGAGVTQPVASAVLDENIPARYRDPDGDWFGLTTRARLFFVAKGRVDPDEPITYEDLATPKWKGRLCMRSGKHAYQVALLASMIAHHGAAKAEAWLKGVKANLARQPQGNDRAQVKAVSQGECDLALGNHYYYGKMLQDPKQAKWAKAVHVRFPNQRDRGTHVNISGMAMAANAPNRDNAMSLMEFLSGAMAQKIYSEANAEYPVKPGVAVTGLLATLGTFKADALPLARIAEHRAEAIKMVDRVAFDR
jgi:iron(III) transport system substrate-binding protein